MKKIETIVRTSKLKEIKLQLELVRTDFLFQQSLTGIEKSLVYRFQNQRGMVYNDQIIPIDYSLLLN
jgi:hypothetical protein